MHVHTPRRSKITMVLALPKSIDNEDAGETALTSEEKTPARNRRPLVFAAVAVVLLGGAVSWRALNTSGSAEASASEPVRRVNVITPERAGGREILLPATLQAYQATDLFARANGFLKVWHFDIGAQVKAGQLLAQIETPELDQELVQAGATLKQAQAEEHQAVAELEEAKADVSFAEANVIKAKADMDFALSLARRSEGLIQARAVAVQEYESDIRQRDTKVAEWESAKAELARRRTNLATRKAIIESRAATVHSREASVQRLRDLTGFQKIYAPFDGVITRRNAEVGMLVTAGSTSGAPLFSMVQIDVLRVHVSVPQSSALDVRVGDAAQVLLPEKPGQIFEAKVTRNAGAVDPVSRSLLVEVELPNDKAALLPGSYVQVRFQPVKGLGRLVVPTKALLMRSSGPHVVMVAADNTLLARKVTLGRDTGSSVEVLIGLEGDERLVVNPADDLRDGEAVEVEGQGEKRMARR